MSTMDREQYNLLLELANSFLDTSQNLGTAELGYLWSEILGGQGGRTLQNPDKMDKPTPPPFGGEDSMDIDDPVQPSTQPSNATLQATTLSINDERTQRLIDNVSPRTNLKQSRKLNDLSARLIMERTGATGKPVFYCIGCLNSSANKATDRLHKHAILCKELARDFPDELTDVRKERKHWQIVHASRRNQTPSHRQYC
ncbi:hypothetical protein K438DRAFT_2136727 [Mycena galopus ATCC 62051]|nr:hypothetical protein K438DRAFT_2136727 [Mycena galopus ATCC 62051]